MNRPPHWTHHLTKGFFEFGKTLPTSNDHFHFTSDFRAQMGRPDIRAESRRSRRSSSHDELLRRGGLYAHLHNMPASMVSGQEFPFFPFDVV